MKKRWLSLLMLLLIAAMSMQGQVKFPENIEHVDPLLPLVDQVQIKGTHWSVLDKTARNAIPDDKREVGMLVTWIESFNYVTKRFEAVNALDVNWTNDANWFGMITQADTIVYADTAFFALNIDPVDSLNFMEIDLPNYQKGNLRFDSASQSLQFQNDLPDFNHNLGYEHVARYFNNTGSLIPDGTLLTPVGNIINGIIVPTVQLAGNGSIDSIQMVAMSTTATPDQNYGVVTLIGPVNGLNTSALNDNDPVYVGHNGLYTNVSPGPPNLSLLVGKVFYADNDSGQIYMFPGAVEFDPSPHISADTSRMSNIVDVLQNVFEYLPISHTIVEDAQGYSVVGDSVLCEVSGFVTIALNLSYIGNAQSDIWRKGVFINGVEKNTVSRSTTSTSVGNSTVISTTSVVVGDYISFKITNESLDRDPTIVDLSWEIIFLHL